MGRDVKEFLKGTRWVEDKEAVSLCFHELGSLLDTWNVSPAGQAGEHPSCLSQRVENCRSAEQEAAARGRQNCSLKGRNLRAGEAHKRGT